jgi:starch-binding outer membrane protein, SusD/RagB family
MTFVLAVATTVTGCDKVKNSLLEAIDPDVIDPSSVQSANGAVAVRNGALSRLRVATADCTGSCGSGVESSWIFGGLLADEWATSSTFVQNDETDQRQIKTDNGTVTSALRLLYRVRTSADQAIELLNKYRPNPTADVGEMYFARGFAELQLASDFCNGIPLSSGSGDEVVLGQPLPVKDVFAAASASFDSAMALSGGTDAASVSINRAARIGKARALLGVGISNAAAAAALVTGIPTTFRYDVTASLTGGHNDNWGQNVSQTRSAVSDSIQGPARNILVKNAIPFVSAKDPRVPAKFRIASNGRDTVKSQDGNTYVTEVPDLWGQTSAMALVHGIDARLIEAEAALKGGDAAKMMTILNTLRATPIQLTAPSPTATGNHPGYTTPAMPALTDPGTQRAREDLLFREMAFWTFGRGQRLGNLRRLIRDYGRAADGSDTFPVGVHYKGGNFGTDVNLPVTTAEQTGNPNFTGCLDRKA